nr:hypothetical protein [Neorhizobium tomejilense]
MNRGLLDDRILFPSTILAGFAKHVLSTRVRDLQVHGLMSRGYNNVVILVTQRCWTFQLSVRFRKVGEGSLIVTSMHRRTRCSGDAFGSMQDDRREFIEQQPENRIVLQTSGDAFRAYYMGAVQPSWNKDLVLRERRKMEAFIRKANFGDTFYALRPNGVSTCILPTVDFGLHPEKLKLIPHAA